MKKVIGFIIGILVIIVLLAASVVSLNITEPMEESVDVDELIAEAGLDQFALSNPVEKSSVPEINDLPLEDNMALYQRHDPSEVLVIYITVRKGNPSDNTDHTWSQVNDETKYFFDTMTNEEVDAAEIIFQIGDEDGPLPGEIGFGEIVPNATIRIRGASSSRRAVKSYKIELRERTGGWQGQYTIPINKHLSDVTRIKNKLSFDLATKVPDIISLRTQFVQLYVKDETRDPPSQTFEDYGLFTYIEQPNGRFLRNHHLDPNAHLYKAMLFEFYRYPEDIRLVDDPLFDFLDFEKRLEIKGNENHAKLIQMLDDINNPAIPIEQSFERYFDVDNYFTWMAFNILVGNVDTSSQNFYLYSPQNSERWYFLLWDYDGAFSRQTREHFQQDLYQPWHEGIHTYAGSVLHKRVLVVEKYRQMLDEKIEAVKSILTPENIQNKLDVYRPVTEPFLQRMPDILYYDPEIYEFSYETIPSAIDNNYQIYRQSLQKPLPFFIYDPEIIDGEMQFSWGSAYDLDAENITYHFQVSRDYDFVDLVVDDSDVMFTQLILNEPLPEGTYFWRVIATNESGYSQFPFNHYIDPNRDLHSGMRLFYVLEDGEIITE